MKKKQKKRKATRKLIKESENACAKIEEVARLGGAGMGIIEEVLKNKEELLVSLFEILQGKETQAKVSLDGVKFKVGKSTVKMEGSVKFTFVPLASRK